MPRPNSQIILWVVLAMVLSFFGCVGKKLMVKNADTLLAQHISKKVRLTSSQKSKLAKDLDQFLTEQKKPTQEMLPVIENLDLDNKESVEKTYKKLSQFYESLTQDFNSLLSDTLSQLSSIQQKEFFQTLEKGNAEIAKKDPKEAHRNVTKRFENFFGSITEKQEQILQGMTGQMESRQKIRLENRTKLHQEFKAIYAKSVPLEAKKDLFESAFREHQTRAYDHAKNLETIKQFLGTISTEQSKKFQEQLKEVKEMVDYYLKVDY